MSPTAKAILPMKITFSPDFINGCLVNFVVPIPSTKSPSKVIAIDIGI